jgi:hypothetical protein
MFRSACGAPPGLPSVVAKINAHLKRALGAGAAGYLVVGGRGAEGYRLTLPASLIAVTPRAIALPLAPGGAAHC